MPEFKEGDTVRVRRSFDAVLRRDGFTGELMAGPYRVSDDSHDAVELVKPAHVPLPVGTTATYPHLSTGKPVAIVKTSASTFPWKIVDMQSLGNPGQLNGWQETIETQPDFTITGYVPGSPADDHHEIPVWVDCDTDFWAKNPTTERWHLLGRGTNGIESLELSLSDTDSYKAKEFWDKDPRHLGETEAYIVEQFQAKPLTTIRLKNPFGTS